MIINEKGNLYDLIDLYKKITDLKKGVIVRPLSTQSMLEFVAKEVWEEIGNLQRQTDIKIIAKEVKK